MTCTEVEESLPQRGESNHEQSLTQKRGCLTVLRKCGHEYKYRSCIILAKIYPLNVLLPIQMSYLVCVLTRVAIAVTGHWLWCLGNNLCLSDDLVLSTQIHRTLLPHCTSEGEVRKQLQFFLPRGNWFELNGNYSFHFLSCLIAAPL